MSRLHGTKDFWIGALRGEGPAFRAALAEAAPDAPVPSCPDWTVTDLVHYLGSYYGWVASVVAPGSIERPAPLAQQDGLPVGSAAIDWWQQQFDRLINLLDGVDADWPAWNWAPQANKAAFWHRRVAQETVLRRWDAQTAIVSVEPIEAKLAADGVSEVLDTWLPAGRRFASEPRHGVAQLVAVDADQEWYLRLRGEGVALLDTDTILDSDDPHARLHAAGSASDLLLALWGRVGFDVLEVTGDETLLTALRAA